jgi:hypothetical protein
MRRSSLGEAGEKSTQGVGEYGRATHGKYEPEGERANAKPSSSSSSSSSSPSLRFHSSLRDERKMWAGDEDEDDDDEDDDEEDEEDEEDEAGATAPSKSPNTPADR